MNRLIVLAAVMSLVACESSVTVDYPDVGFVTPDVSQIDLPMLEDDVPDFEPDAEVDYPDFGLLEYFDQYGDNNTVCWGFADPPMNNKKIDHCTFEMSYNTDRTFKVMYFEDGKRSSGNWSTPWMRIPGARWPPSMPNPPVPTPKAWPRSK